MTRTKTRRQANRRTARFRNVLVVCKRSYLMEVRAQNERRTLDMLEQGDPRLNKVVRSDAEHQASMEAVLGALRKLRIEHKAIWRESLEEEISSGRYDLVVTVGGDGTVLDASHSLTDAIPILGVNSALSSSHGHYCIAHIHNFEAVLRRVLYGTDEPLRIMRLEITVDGERAKELCLNEVMIAHEVLGATSRYTVNVNGFTEDHKSDGLFVAAPGGTTGWIRSYGADVLPIDSRYLQFLARGLIVPPGKEPRLEQGLASGKITVVSDMPGGKVLIDGRHIVYSFERGSKVTIAPAQQDLRIFIDANVNARYAQPAGRRREPPRH